MKRIFVIASLFLGVYVNAQNKTTIEFVELNAGMIEANREKSEIEKNSPTGSRGSLADFVFIALTDSVPAVLKNNFGVEYMIKTPTSTDVEVTIEWIYPKKIKNDWGKQYKSVKYVTQRYTNEPTLSSYSLDEPYEVVKGKWKINIYAYNKLLYSKVFYLY